MSANCLFSFGFFFSVFSDTVFHVTDFQCNCANGLRWMIQSPVDKMCGQIRSVMRDTWVLGQLLLYWHGGPSSSSSLTARSEQSLTNNGSRRKAEQKKVTNTSISGIYVHIYCIYKYIYWVCGVELICSKTSESDIGNRVVLIGLDCVWKSNFHAPLLINCALTQHFSFHDPNFLLPSIVDTLTLLILWHYHSRCLKKKKKQARRPWMLLFSMAK